MTKLFKNSKQVLSFVLAFAVLAVSLFTGVVINSDAACANKVVKYWDGTTKTEPTETDKDGNILISSPAELAWLAENGSTATAKYKVADGIDAFIMQPETVVDAEELMAIDSYEETKTYFETLAASDNKPVKWIVKAANVTAVGAFAGTFDGNGIEIYGLYYPDKQWKATALFPHVGANVTIKNLAVRNSYLAIMSYVGAIFGQSVAGSDSDRITVDSVAVTGSWIYNNEATLKDNGTPDDTSDDYINYFADRAGMMFGNVGGLIDISNCFVYANKVSNANNQDLPYAFAPSIKNTWKTTELNHSFSNCVLLGGYPYNKGSYNAYLPELFSNVYTDMDVTEGKYSYNESQMAQITVDGVKGAAGMAAMNLDWDNVWLANAGIPELRVFHDIADEATAGTSGHTYKCADCELVTAEYAHTYGADGACTACGATQKCGENVIYWDSAASVSTADDLTGTGDVDDPFIIDSVADLAYVAQGADGDTDGEYYKIADGIDALVLQEAAYADAIMALDNAADVETYFTTNKSSMKQWATTTSSTTTGFNGILDGNGATIYGLYDKGAYNYGHGLFSMGRGFTVNDLAFKNNYVYGDNAAILCGMSRVSEAKFYVNDCIFANNVVICERLNDDNAGMGGLMFGSTTDGYIYIDGCLVYGNSARHSDTVDYWAKDANNQSHRVTIDKYDAVYGLWGSMSGPTQNAPETNNTVSNSVILDTAPYSMNWSYDGHCTTYTNVYTNMTDIEFVNTHSVTTGKYEDYKTVLYVYNIKATTDENGTDISLASYVDGAEEPRGTITTLDRDIRKIAAADIQGAGAVEKLELDWVNTWFAVEGDMPTLRTFHKDITAADNEDGTHSESCNCGLVGAAVAHTFDKTAADGVCTVCGGECAHADEDIKWVSNNDGTCTDADTGHYECTACGLKDDEMENPEFVAKHNGLKFVAAVPSTCTDDGTIEHYHCDDCGNDYKNEAATEKLDSIVDEADGHSPIKDDKDEIVYSMDVSGHAKTCAVCGEKFEQEGHEGEYTYDAEGHTGECVVCGWDTTLKETHTFVDGACATCPYECPHNDEDIVWKSNNDGTCTKADTGHYECTACELKDDEMENPEFVAKDHIEGTPVESDRVEASCTENGSYVKTVSCTECGAQISQTTETIPAEGHTLEAYDGYAEDCINDGEKAHKWCSVCEEYFAATEEDKFSTNYVDYEDLIIPADPEAHVWEEIEAEAATCEEPGCVAHTICSSCLLAIVDGEEIQIEIDWDALYDELEEINPDDYNSEEDYYAAIEEIAIKYSYAAYDDAGILIPAAHKISEVKEVAATTEKEGTKAHYACSECDKLFTDAEGKNETTAEELVIAKLAAEDKGDDKTDDNKTETKPDGDKSDESPKTGESVAAVAAVAALMGAAFVIIRKARKA